MRSYDEVLLSAYHEAAHAVFAHHDNIDVDDVVVSDNRGGCTIDRADLYERYLPFRYAQFFLAGAYAALIARELRHPKPVKYRCLGLSRGRSGRQEATLGAPSRH